MCTDFDDARDRGAQHFYGGMAQLVAFTRQAQATQVKRGIEIRVIE
jgi:hypothetical protein